MRDVTHFDAETVFSTLTPAEAVTALTDALRSGFDPATDITRTISDISAGNMIYMPSEIGSWMGVKLAGVSIDNPSRGLPRIMAQYLMFDSTTLELKTTIDGAALTTLRTPAVSVAAVLPTLSRFTSPANIVVFGAGPQGTGHVDTFSAVLDAGIGDVTFIVRTPERASTQAHERGTVIAASSAEVEAALTQADIVVAATTAGQPLFDAALVRKGAVVIACGSHDADRRELPGELFRDATVIVEATQTALREGGDVIMAIADGALTETALIPMQDFVSSPQEIPAEQTVIFKGSGMSWEDLAVASSLVEKVG